MDDDTVELPEAFIFPGHDATGTKQFADRTEMHTIEFWPGYE